MTADPLELVREANPVTSLTLDSQDACRADDLLARLQCGVYEAGCSADLSLGERRTPGRVLIAGVAAVVILATASVAVAEGVPPFSTFAAFIGIGSANHAETPADALDSESLRLIDQMNDSLANLARRAGIPPTAILPGTARLVSQLPSGRRVYVVGTTDSKLCVLTEPPAGSRRDSMASLGCGDPLSESQPTTIEGQDQVVNGPNATPPLAFGVARDGVTAVSFMAHGTEHTIPIKDNVWAYEGQNSAGESLTVHYANGSTQTIIH